MVRIGAVDAKIFYFSGTAARSFETDMIGSDSDSLLTKQSALRRTIPPPPAHKRAPHSFICIKSESHIRYRHAPIKPCTAFYCGRKSEDILAFHLLRSTAILVVVDNFLCRL